MSKSPSLKSKWPGEIISWVMISQLKLFRGYNFLVGCNFLVVDLLGFFKGRKFCYSNRRKLYPIW